MASQAAQRTNRLDVLINNAGRPTAGRLSEATSEELGATVTTNLLGPIWCTRELLGLLGRTPPGARTPLIVNVASMAGRVPTPGAGDYAASKFGLVGFTESAWAELGSMGVRIMMLNPGLTDTEGFPMQKVRDAGFGWSVMAPERVVRAMFRGIDRGAFEVRVQWWMHPLYLGTVAIGPLRRFAAGRVRRSMGDIGKL